MELMYCQTMKRRLHTILVLGGLALFGAGCANATADFARNTGTYLHAQPDSEDAVVLPINEGTHGYDPSYRRFGEYFADGRFTGYHVAEDSEVTILGDTYPVEVVAIADGEVRFVDWISGYGGVMTVWHQYGCRIEEDYREGCRYVTALYGHIDRDSARFRVGDRVHKGDVLAQLGDEGPKTDGERKHLHFALYSEDDVNLAGYVSRAEDVDDWINPRDFFDALGATKAERGWQFARDLQDPFGRDTFPLDFELPADWDIEWVPSLEAWNLYDTRGAGTARERSQIFIRYFDASDFLTLQTVTIHSATDRTVGDANYVARQYDIEKKPDAAAFKDQPSWRNERHVVTDFRGEKGFTRYFVVAANPDLDTKVYERVLRSIHILTEDDQTGDSD